MWKVVLWGRIVAVRLFRKENQEGKRGKRIIKVKTNGTMPTREINEQHMSRDYVIFMIVLTIGKLFTFLRVNAPNSLWCWLLGSKLIFLCEKKIERGIDRRVEVYITRSCWIFVSGWFWHFANTRRRCCFTHRGNGNLILVNFASGDFESLFSFDVNIISRGI